MSEEQRQELMNDPEKWLKIVTKDGETLPFKLNSIQRMLWDKFQPWPPGTRITYVQMADGKYRWVPIINP